VLHYYLHDGVFSGSKRIVVVEIKVRCTVFDFDGLAEDCVCVECSASKEQELMAFGMWV